MRVSRQHQARAEPTAEPEPGTKPACVAVFMVGRSADEVLGQAQTYFARR